MVPIRAYLSHHCHCSPHKRNKPRYHLSGSFTFPEVMYKCIMIKWLKCSNICNLKKRHKLRGHILGNGQLGLQTNTQPRDATMIISQKTEGGLLCQGKVNRANHQLRSGIGKSEGHFFHRRPKGQHLNIKDWPYYFIKRFTENGRRSLKEIVNMTRHQRWAGKNVTKKTYPVKQHLSDHV